MEVLQETTQSIFQEHMETLTIHMEKMCALVKEALNMKVILKSLVFPKF